MYSIKKDFITFAKEYFSVARHCINMQQNRFNIHIENWQKNMSKEKTIEKSAGNINSITGNIVVKILQQTLNTSQNNGIYASSIRRQPYYHCKQDLS